MKTSITYTVLSVLNLIGFTVGVLFLPESVPINLMADLYGSPWVFVAFPAAAAIFSAAVWAAGAKAKNKKFLSGVLTGVFAGAGAILAIIGWVFFIIAAVHV